MGRLFFLLASATNKGDDVGNCSLLAATLGVFTRDLPYHGKDLAPVFFFRLVGVLFFFFSFVLFLSPPFLSPVFLALSAPLPRNTKYVHPLKRSTSIELSAIQYSWPRLCTPDVGEGLRVLDPSRDLSEIRRRGTRFQAHYQWYVSQPKPCRESTKRPSPPFSR